MAGESGTALQEVTIEAVHGSLECAGRHVLVGHFMGAAITGSEGFLDERLGLRLSARHLLGHYPERVGESEIVDNPGASAAGRWGYPPGAIVVGLGLPGELTREKLTNSVSAALLGYAIRTLEQRVEDEGPAAGPLLLEVAAVPIGTSGVGGMSVETCIAALVDGVIAANGHVRSHVDPASGSSTWDQVRFARLEIVEVLGDKAEQVAHAVIRSKDLAQVDTLGHTRLALGDRLHTGEGGLPASLSGNQTSGDWQRVIIRDPRREQQQPGQVDPGDEGATVLEFTAVGRRARADRMQVAVDYQAVGGLVDVAVRDARPNVQVGSTLYELLLPNDLKSDLARSENLQLIVDENTADLPWEALTARLGGSRPRQLSLRGGFLRQFRETEARRPEARTPSGDNVLVIANPPIGQGLSLSGASREGVAVAEALRGFEVRGLVWDVDQEEGDERARLLDSFEDVQGTPGQRVLGALFSRDWRIVHIAAHGQFHPGDSSSSGAIIDKTTALTANVFRQLPAVPELVFLNCCHLGRVGGLAAGVVVPNRLAASVARELMRIGVRVVVAAGWAVNDEAAVVFAKTFYDALLEGAAFGPAVQYSRKAVHERFPDSSTWAAFQCYGDPGYHLRSTAAPSSTPPTLVSPAELVRRLQTITVLAGKIGLPDFEDISRDEAELRQELDRLRHELPKKGWDVPLALYELGRAYASLGDYENAVACYGRAWNHTDSSMVPVKLLEQLGNLEIGLAQRRFRRAGQDAQPPAVEDVLQRARRHLDLALGLGRSPERLALMGSFHKKGATMSTGPQRLEHLEQAARHYREAHQRHLADGHEAKPYFALNWLQMATIAGNPVASTEAGDLLASMERPPPGDGHEDVEEDFWARVTAADLSLTRSVLDGAPHAAELEEKYQRAFHTRSSRRDRDSVVDHLRDIAALVDRSPLDDLARRLGAP